MKKSINREKLKKAFFIVVLVIGILLCIATIAAIPVSTDISLGTVFPAMTGTVLIAYGWIKLKRKKKLIPWKGVRIAVTAIVVLGIALFAALECVIIAYGNTGVPDEDANYCLVLGGGIFPDGHLSLSLKNRLDTAAEYLKNHEDVICIVSGGKGETEPVAEAYAMQIYLVSEGIDADRILTEQNSFSTHDNMTLSAKLMDETHPELEKTAVIVTNDFHIFRALAVAKDRGITGYGLACPTPLLVKVTSYMREFLTIINTFLFQMV